MRTLRRGDIRQGLVVEVTNAGALVDLGDQHGVVNNANLSWRPFEHPSQVVRVGQKVLVMVLGMDDIQGHAVLSIRDLEPDPLREFALQNSGATCNGRVTRITPIGTFVALEGQVTGLVPVVDGVSDDQLKGSAPVVGDEVRVTVVNVNLDRRQVELSLYGSEG
ncbi:S1 RNA-binding domain-containing protein [Plantactinospora sp. WMMC1484]|uniref:S1 RNA-binding domain-containing protein n=1 Tax=Plantactinospora sp. WMMC1484 TaxID=3404122 RepID=UPI003BF55DD1